MQRWLLVVVWIVAGCATDEAGQDDYPVRGGGGTVAGDTTPTGSDGGDAFQVCLLTDPRDLTTCEPSGAGGLRVELGTKIGGTLDNGTFMIDASDGGGNNFVVSGASIVTSIMPFGYGGTFPIPVITTTAYAAMQTANGVTAAAGEGALMVVVEQGGSPYIGATAISIPAASYEALYDGDSPPTWATGAGGTGPFGTIWIPGVAEPAASITVFDSTLLGGGGVSGLPVVAGAITFAPVSL